MKKDREESDPPDAYAFLQAAGELKHHKSETLFAKAELCGRELVRLSEMNGTYKLLPSKFRKEIRAVFAEERDVTMSPKLQSVGEALLRAADIQDDSEREALQKLCSALARVWPDNPKVLAK